MSENLILDELKPKDNVFYGMPEVYAFKRKEMLEKQHMCQLRFLYVQMGGSVWPIGHPNFKVEDIRSTVAVWEKI